MGCYQGPTLLKLQRGGFGGQIQLYFEQSRWPRGQKVLVARIVAIHSIQRGIRCWPLRRGVEYPLDLCYRCGFGRKFNVRSSPAGVGEGFE